MAVGVRLCKSSEPRLNIVPEPRFEDAEIRSLLADPLFSRPGNGPPTPGVRVLEEARFVPDPDAGVLLVAEDHVNRGNGPPASLRPALGVLRGKGDPLGVERVDDSPHAPPAGIVLEDAPDDARLRRVDLEARGRLPRPGTRILGEPDGSVPEQAPAGTQAACHSTREPAVGFLGQVLEVDGVHHAFDGDVHGRAAAACVHAIGDADEVDGAHPKPAV
jgi:hypothetical protein